MRFFPITSLRLYDCLPKGLDFSDLTMITGNNEYNYVATNKAKFFEDFPYLISDKLSRVSFSSFIYSGHFIFKCKICNTSMVKIKKERKKRNKLEVAFQA